MLDTKVFERRLGDNFGDLYSLSDGKWIVKALRRLCGDELAAVNSSAKDDLRTAWVDIGEAADTLFLDLEWRLKDLISVVKPTAAQAISKAIYRAHSPHWEAESPDPNGVPAKPIHRYWVLLGSSKEQEWRPILKELGRGRMSLRFALKKHPTVRKALLSGLIEAGLREEAGRRWLRWLERAGPEVMKSVASAARNDSGLKEEPGRPDQTELINFTRRIIDIAERYSGKKITASMHFTSSRTSDKVEQNISPGVEFVHACVKPLYPSATWDSCARLIRKAR